MFWLRIVETANNLTQTVLRAWRQKPVICCDSCFWKNDICSNPAMVTEASGVTYAEGAREALITSRVM